MEHPRTVQQLRESRQRKGEWTEDKVLAIAGRTEFCVSKYSYSHEKLRKLTRRMCKDGKLVLVMYNGKQFFYLAKKKETPCPETPSAAT